MRVFVTAFSMRNLAQISPKVNPQPEKALLFLQKPGRGHIRGDITRKAGSRQMVT